ncbi:hypothetical protein FRB93_013789 [Tulasnella sp. JGI-2019a]|nr:hypothetical protein FRB93_013789 [Tulasnella sp. JGI-2019a]
MGPLILSVLATLLIAVQAQVAWSPCDLYCFPGNQQTGGALQAAGSCPSLLSLTSTPFFTSACACYNYLASDGTPRAYSSFLWVSFERPVIVLARFTGCYTCSSVAPGVSYQDACPPTQPIPTASASCQSQNDPISQACTIAMGIIPNAGSLCDLGSGLSILAKAVFGNMTFLSTPMARSSLSIVEAGCKMDVGVMAIAAEAIIGVGCDMWTKIGRCSS